MITEIRVTGFGGQGIIKLGYLIGKAASIFDGKSATLTQSFGPEARGSACSAQVVVSDDRVLYPYITTPQILIAMSQEGYTKYQNDLEQKGTLLVDEDLVKNPQPREGVKFYSISATRIAEEMGNRMIANLVMLGFFTAVTNIVSPEAGKKSIPGSVPERFVELNTKAFKRGLEYGKTLLANKKSK
jgi:2-oxoglutarate ferredoxin oxidoreductase subunit gamma